MTDPEMSKNQQQGSTDGPSAADANESYEDRLQQIEQELAETSDRLLRAHAELDNVRKRAHREMEEERRYANLPLLRDLLGVLDNVERAVGAAEANPESSGLLEGVKLVAQQLESILARHHCTRIDALHQPFDPHVHQAILQQPSDEYPENTVLMIAQSGFRLHDRVIRPAQVIVSTTPK